MKILYTFCFLISFFTTAQNVVTPLSAPTSMWGAYMTWHGEGGNGDNWGINDLKSTVAVNLVRLQPNFSIWRNEYNNDYWFDENGNCKFYPLEASTFVTNNNLQGADLEFTGAVTNYTLDAAYTAEAFIKVFDESWNMIVSKLYLLEGEGNFTVTATQEELASGVNIQYGFVVNGPAANPAEESALGNVTLGEALSTASFSAQRISMVPNPARGQVALESNVPVEHVVFYNVIGQPVLRLTGDTKTIDVSALRSGLYVVAVQSRNKQYSTKLFIE